MKFRYPLVTCLFFAALSFLPGQEAAPPDSADQSGPFPLSLLLEAALAGDIPWRPDWPAAMPPDGFSLNSGQVLSLTLTLPAGFLDPTPSEASGDTPAAAGTIPAGDDADGETSVEYRIIRNADGRLLEFPFFLNGNFYQVGVHYDTADPVLIRKITLDNPASQDPGENTFEFEFLEYRQEEPSLVRIKLGETWYFVAPEYLERRVNETWYDPEGLAQAFFSLEYRAVEGKKRLFSIDSRSDQGQAILVYEYNSAGRISGISALDGEYAALYTAAAQVRYWERPEGNYTLQWDEKGFLVRMTGVLTGDSSAPQQSDIRYEYTLDERGNWTERREISFARLFGRLVPNSETVIHRTISYGDK
ncbi:hypothetical protein [Treponema primitia]|uniref:hypothetical protein n=1 Tax=Treponema primitia TaxID=88058 RepID=UPI0002554FBB|nr:hypothetical protein [Treponema primitia]